MSVYNDSGYIRGSLNSIIEQTYPNLEIIIINDGSDEKTSSILDEIQKFDSRIQLIHQNNHGLAYSLNRGIKEAAGEFIARMDSDDISNKDRICRQVEFLIINKDVVAVGSNATVIDKDGEYVYTTNKPLTWKQIKDKLPQSPLIHPSVMFRRKEAVDVGGYPIVPISQDLFFFNKLVEKGKFANLKEPLLEYRMHPKSLSRKSRDIKRIVFKLLDRFLKSEKMDEELLKQLQARLDAEKDNKEYFYHLLLGKKYLWDNYSGNKSRFHFNKAIDSTKKINEYFEPLILYLLSFLGKKNIYRFYKYFGENTPSKTKF